MEAERIFFYVFAALASISAIGAIGFPRNVAAGLLSLLVTMVSLSGIYVLLEAHFIAAVQLLVYAGAILVLFVFVLMLLRIDDFGPVRPTGTLLKLIGATAGAGVFLLLATVVIGALPESRSLPTRSGYGGFRDFGLQLFTSYLVPLEAAGMVLLTAIIGAVVLAKRRVD